MSLDNSDNQSYSSWNTHQEDVFTNEQTFILPEVALPSTRDDDHIVITLKAELNVYKSLLQQEKDKNDDILRREKLLEIENQMLKLKLNDVGQNKLENISDLSSCSSSEPVSSVIKSTKSPTTSESSSTGKKNDLRSILKHKMRIRHKIGNDDIWYAIYNKKNDYIENFVDIYKSLSAFSGAHYKKSRPDRTSASNGWTECEVCVDSDEEVWVKADKLRK